MEPMGSQIPLPISYWKGDLSDHIWGGGGGEILKSRRGAKNQSLVCFQRLPAAPRKSSKDAPSLPPALAVFSSTHPLSLKIALFPIASHLSVQQVCGLAGKGLRPQLFLPALFPSPPLRREQSRAEKSGESMCWNGLDCGRLTPCRKLSSVVALWRKWSMILGS